MAKASSFSRLGKRVWYEKDLVLRTKIAVYRAMVFSLTLSVSESWTTSRCHVKALEKFHHRYCRQNHGYKVAGHDYKNIYSGSCRSDKTKEMLKLWKWKLKSQMEGKELFLINFLSISLFGSFSPCKKFKRTYCIVPYIPQATLIP